MRSYEFQIKNSHLIHTLNRSRDCVVWQLDWVSPFESPWGILEKFRFANAASIDDIFYLMGSELVKNKKSKQWSNRDRNLFTLDGIGDTSVEEVLGCNYKQSVLNESEQLLGVLPIRDASLYYHKSLTYCLRCIQAGHHSLFHQSTLIDRCPYHATKLRNKCPSCKREIPYMINDSWSKSPFTCLCGYSFLKGSSYRAITRRWREPRKPILIPELTEWLCIDKDETQKVQRTYSHEETALKYHRHLIKWHLSIVKNDFESDKSSNHFMVTSRAITHRIDPSLNKVFKRGNYHQWVIDEIYESTLHTISAIAKHYRKNFEITRSDHKTVQLRRPWEP